MTTRLRTIAVASALVLTLPLTACIGGGEPGPTPTNTTVGTTAPPPSSATPTPTPTWKCSSATGASCTKTLAEKEAAIAEAVAVYLDFNIQFEKALGDPNTSSTPAALNAMLGEPSVKPVSDAIKDFRAKDFRLVGQSKIRLTSKVGEVTMSANELKLNFCADSTAVVTVTGPDNRFVGVGTVSVNSVTFKRNQQNWIIWSQTEKAVKSC